MAGSESVEYSTLVHYTDQLTKEVSKDPERVSYKLFEKSLISSIRDIRSKKENSLKASELIEEVKSKVKGSPDSFKTFLDILNEFTFLKEVVKEVWDHYKANKVSFVDHGKYQW